MLDFALLMDEDNRIQVNYLLECLIAQVKERPVKETNNGQDVDNVFAGYLQVTQSLLETVSKAGKGKLLKLRAGSP